MVGKPKEAPWRVGGTGDQREQDVQGLLPLLGALDLSMTLAKSPSLSGTRFSLSKMRGLNKVSISQTFNQSPKQAEENELVSVV